MSFVYNAVLDRAAKGGMLFTTGVFRWLLLTAASDVNPDDDNLDDVLGRAGTTEVDDGTVTSYARQLEAYTGTTNQAGSVELDEVNDRAEWHTDDITFDLATGGPVSIVGAIKYLDVEGDDSDDTTAIPYFFLTLNQTDITGLTLAVGADGQAHVTDETP